MTENERQLLETLEKIAELASTPTNRDGDGGGDYEEEQGAEYAPADTNIGCTIKSLPKRLLVKAAETAIKINPVNAPVIGALAEVAAELDLEPQHLAVLTSKYWGPTPRRLTVSFMDNPSAALRARILSHMNAWTKTGYIQFVETQGTGQVRISRGASGY